MGKVKLIKVISIVFLFFFCASAMVPKKWFCFSCNNYFAIDSASDAQFQNCINKNFPIIDKFSEIIDSIEFFDGNEKILDSLVKGDKKNIFSLIKGLADSNKIKNKSDDEIVNTFLSISQKNIINIETVQNNLSQLRADSSKAEIAIRNNRKDSSLIIQKKSNAIANSKKLSKTDKNYDSLLKQFQIDTSNYSKELNEKTNKWNNENATLITTSKSIKDQTKSIDSDYHSLELNLKTFYGEFSIANKGNNDTLDKLISLAQDIINKNYEKTTGGLNKSNLDSRRKKMEKDFTTASNNFDEFLNKDTTPISQYHFYFKDDKHYFTFYVINTEMFNIKVHNNSTKAGRTLKGQYDLLKSKGIIPVALMNGGMFNPDFGPTGFMITDDGNNNKKTIVVSPLNDKEGSGNFFMKPNGVFIVDDSNKYYVLSTDDFKKNKELNQLGYKKIKYATQSGPMLIYNGKMNSQFKKGSSNLNIRNAIGVSAAYPKKVFMAISDDKVNFYDIAFLFKYVFKCDNALYLDGVVSKLFFNNPKSQKQVTPDDTQSLGPILSVSKKIK